MAVVLVVSFDSGLRQSLARALAAEDFSVAEATGGLDAIRIIFDTRPEAAIVDLRVTDVLGVDLIRIVRAASDLAIIALAVGSQSARSVQALEAGADDVARTTTSVTELMARLRAAMRRSLRQLPSTATNTHVIHTGALVIDRDARSVTRHGEHVSLTRTEYRLLDALASRVGQVAPHRFLLSAVWGDAYADDTHYLRIYIAYLRGKLEDNPASPIYLLSEWSVGYRLALLPAMDSPSDERLDDTEDDSLPPPGIEVPNISDS